MSECQSKLARVTLSSVIIAIVLVFAGCGHRAASYLAKGEEDLARRKYHDALMQFRSAAELDDSSAKAHWGLARTYEALGQFNEVLDELRKTVESDDTNLEAKAKLASYYLLVQPPMVSEAEKLRDQIASADPNFIEGEVLTASIMAAQGKPDADVISQVEKAIAMDPKRIESYVSLERLYMTREKAADAETAIKRGIEANPASPAGYTEYGRFLMYANRDEEAEAQFQKAIATDNGSIDAREAIAEFYTNTQQYPKAEQEYIQLVKVQDNSPESRLELAKFYNKSDKQTQAISTLDQILADSPTYVLARYKLAEIYLAARQPAKVKEQLDPLLNVNDEDTTALMLRAKLGLQQNDPDAAIKDVEEVLKKYPSDRDGLFLMAQARLAMGQIDHANAFIADLERYHPTYLKTGLLKIQCAFAADDAQAALKLSNEILDRSNQVQPDADQDTSDIQEVRIRAVTSRGLAFLQLGNLAGARNDLENAAKMSPRSASAIVNLAKVSVAEKNAAAALDLYEKALAMDSQNFDAIAGVVANCIKLQQTPKAHDRIVAMASSNADRPDVLAALKYLNSTVFEAEKNNAAAETELQAAISLDSTYLTAYTAYADLLARQNRIDEAAAQYKAVLEKRPTAQVWTLLGILEDGRGNIAAAETAYRRALEITPETPIAANNLAWIIAENGGNLDEALQLATLAVTKSPRSAGFYDTLGWVYLKKGLNSPAIEQMRKAVAMDEASAKANGIQPNAAYRTRLGTAVANSIKG
jgi:tetratricopeptide (TPR) repeat protein